MEKLNLQSKKFMAFLIVVVAIILYLLFVWIRIQYVVRTAALQSFSYNDTIVGQGSQLRYIAAGDSVTAGQGASSVENTFSQKILQEFAKKNHVSYKNIAVSKFLQYFLRKSIFN